MKWFTDSWRSFITQQNVYDAVVSARRKSNGNFKFITKKIETKKTSLFLIDYRFNAPKRPNLFRIAWWINWIQLNDVAKNDPPVPSCFFFREKIEILISMMFLSIPSFLAVFVVV